MNNYRSPVVIETPNMLNQLVWNLAPMSELDTAFEFINMNFLRTCNLAGYIINIIVKIIINFIFTINNSYIYFNLIGIVKLLSLTCFFLLNLSTLLFTSFLYSSFILINLFCCVLIKLFTLSID